MDELQMERVTNGALFETEGRSDGRGSVDLAW